MAAPAPLSLACASRAPLLTRLALTQPVMRPSALLAAQPPLRGLVPGSPFQALPRAGRLPQVSCRRCVPLQRLRVRDSCRLGVQMSLLVRQLAQARLQALPRRQALRRRLAPCKPDWQDWQYRAASSLLRLRLALP